MIQNLVHDAAREIHGYRKADALDADITSAVLAEYRGIDADQLAQSIDERAARVAGIDRRDNGLLFGRQVIHRQGRQPVRILALHALGRLPSQCRCSGRMYGAAY